MGIAGISGTIPSTSPLQTQVQIEVLRRAQDLQGQQVQQLLQALPQTAVAPGQPGWLVNTFA